MNIRGRAYFAAEVITGRRDRSGIFRKRIEMTSTESYYLWRQVMTAPGQLGSDVWRTRNRFRNPELSGLNESDPVRGEGNKGTDGRGDHTRCKKEPAFGQDGERAKDDADFE